MLLHFFEWPGDEQAVICLHGITANSHAFEGIAEKLSPAHRVVAMDLRGRGGSDTPPNGATTLTSMPKTLRDSWTGSG
jgi:pimeloyl-ACP methyl ester carboxylesterase